MLLLLLGIAHEGEAVPLMGTAHEGGGATSQLDIPSLSPLSVAGCGRLQQGVAEGYFCRLLLVDDN